MANDLFKNNAEKRGLTQSKTLIARASFYFLFVCPRVTEFFILIFSDGFLGGFFPILVGGFFYNKGVFGLLSMRDVHIIKSNLFLVYLFQMSELSFSSLSLTSGTILNPTGAR